VSDRDVRRARQSMPHGERIAILEERADAFEVTMIDVKSELKTFNKRWLIGIGIFCGVVIAAGNGTVSLKSLLDLLAKFVK
jgi:hypothetical protein